LSFYLDNGEAHIMDTKEFFALLYKKGKMPIEVYADPDWDHVDIATYLQIDRRLLNNDEP